MARPALDEPCAAPEDPTQAELVHIWQDLLEVEPVGIRDDFFDLGGDSLLAAAMMAAIEEATGVDASPSILLSGSTIEHIAASLAQPAKPDTAMVPVQAAGSKAPLYFLHGDYLGRGMYCRKIARALGPDQPVFALTPCGLDGEPAPPTIEEMAARHLLALRRQQAHGPYRLVGNCNGGLIALEMARRLVEEGETVEQVLVIRTSAQNVRFSTARRLVERCSRFLGLGVETQRDLIRRWRWFVQAWSAGTTSQRIGLIAGKLVRLVRRPAAETSIGGPRRPAPPTGTPDEHVHRCRQRVRTASVSGEGGGVLARGEPEPAPAALKWWRRVSPRAEVETIPGDHLTCITVHGQALRDG